MILHLHIRNIALIEDVSMDFNDGLNILSGETGAGKSMIIDAVHFVLGGRASKDLVRKEADQALVEALFSISPEIRQTLTDQGIEIDKENQELLLSRTMNRSGKSSCRINGQLATQSMLKDIASQLIDIHGQHDHQSLLNPEKHIDLLDIFCGQDMMRKKQDLAAFIKEYREQLILLKSLSGNEEERQQKMEMLSYQIEEIEEAGLVTGEEEQLLAQKKLVSSAEKILRLGNDAIQKLSGEESGALDALSGGLESLKELAGLDESLKALHSTALNAYDFLADVSRELSAYLDQYAVEPDELEKIEDRLTVIYRLKQKYGQTIQDILDVKELKEKELSDIENSREKANELQHDISQLRKKILHICEQMSELRKKQAGEIEHRIAGELKQLGMKHAEFQILVENKKEFGLKGMDRVEFLLSPNAGEEVKPLHKIASGGEMSRVMLAMKTVLSAADPIETFVFDEIDTGVSGRTAQKVAEKLAYIKCFQQIICITHLPQIAAMADSHFLIEKNVDKDITTTSVQSLDSKQSVNEISRLLGGAKITESTVRAATEMKEMAEQFKEQVREDVK